MSDIINDINKNAIERYYFRSYGNPTNFLHGGLYISDLDSDGKFHFLACTPADVSGYRFICGEFSHDASWIRTADVIQKAKQSGSYNGVPLFDTTTPYFAKAVIEYYSPENCGVNWDTHMQQIEVEREMDDWLNYADFEEGGTAAWW